MSDGEAEGAAGRLRALQARFGASLRERLDRLDALVEVARRGSAGGALAEALVVAHRLSGTAGTFGHVEAGEAAAELEEVLRRIAEGSPEEAQWDRAMLALSRVRAAASAPGLG